MSISFRFHLDFIWISYDWLHVDSTGHQRGPSGTQAGHQRDTSGTPAGHQRDNSGTPLGATGRAAGLGAAGARAGQGNSASPRPQNDSHTASHARHARHEHGTRLPGLGVVVRGSHSPNLRYVFWVSKIGVNKF